MHIPKDVSRADIIHKRYLVSGEYEHSNFKAKGLQVPQKTKVPFSLKRLK
jgi:hypothetical protein